MNSNSYFMWIMLAGLLVMFFLMTRSSKKRAQQQKEQVEEALKPGNWVMTRAGFYGRVVDVDGSVVILEAPNGEESWWDKSAIAVAKEPPFANLPADEQETEEGSDVKAPAEDTPDTNEKKDDEVDKK